MKLIPLDLDRASPATHLARDASSASVIAVVDGGRVVRAREGWTRAGGTAAATRAGGTGGDDDDDASRDAVRAIRRAFGASSGETSSGAVWTHVAFHGRSPARWTRTCGTTTLAAQRDGGIAAWTRDRIARAWVPAVDAPYAGAPPIACEGFGRMDAWRGDCVALAACAASDGSTYAATLSGEGGVSGVWLVIRRVLMRGARDGAVVASARYADAERLESAGGEDFWVATRSGVFYRWNCRLARAVARVDARAYAVGGGAMLTCLSFPDGALVCARAAARRAFVVGPALGTAGERVEPGVEHEVEELCELEMIDGDSTEIVSVARHGAFLWIATRDAADDSCSVRVFHASSGASISSVSVPAPTPVSASSPLTSPMSTVVELVNADTSGMYARVYAPDACTPSYRCVISVPLALAKVIEPILLNPAGKLKMIDKMLSEVEMYGASAEVLARALVLARREVENAPEAFKAPREAAATLISKYARASCAVLPALLLRAQLTGRFDDIASARWQFAAKEAIELLESASASDVTDAFSSLASATVDRAREALLADREILRVDAQRERASEGIANEGDELAVVVRELETWRGERLPPNAWAGARALAAFRDSPTLAPFIDAVWRETPVQFASDSVEAKVQVSELVDAASLLIVETVTALTSSAAFAPFEATAFLLYRFAPQCAVPFIDAVASVTSRKRSELAKRALMVMESPEAHLHRFGDGVAAEALTRAIAETLCAADLTRSGMYVALSFGGISGRNATSSERATAKRGKTTLAGWMLAHDVLRAELSRRQKSVDDARHFAAEAFDLMSKSFRTLIEDWNEMPLRQSPEDVDVDVAAELMLGAADVARSLYDVDAVPELDSHVLTLARKHSTTMTELLAAHARGEHSPEHVDSLERLIVAVASTLRSARLHPTPLANAAS